jgi:carbon storage regulator
MLVLTRKPGEEIVIGDNIRLTVVAICGSQVRLGLTAPRAVSIQREELRNVPRPPPSAGNARADLHSRDARIDADPSGLHQMTAVSPSCCWRLSRTYLPTR